MLMKMLVEIDTGLAYHTDACDLIDEILRSGIDMVNHSPDIKEGISWEIIREEQAKEWDDDANV